MVHRGKQTGLALGTVLVFLVILTFIGIAGIHVTSTEVSMSATHKQQIGAFQEADGAPMFAIAHDEPLVEAISAPCTWIRFPDKDNAEHVKSFGPLDPVTGELQYFPHGGHAMVRAHPVETVMPGWSIGENTEFTVYEIEVNGRANEGKDMTRYKVTRLGPSMGELAVEQTSCT